MPSVDIAFLPSSIRDPVPDVCVVFDVLRATTTMGVLLGHGAAGIRAVGEVAKAVAWKNADPTVLLAGERGGIPPEGFELGNSPVGIDPERVRGRVIVMTTTNGTAAVERVAGAGVLIMGSLINLDAVTARLVELGRDALLVCSGTDGGRSDEDELAAGMLVERLRGWHRTDAADDAVDRATGSIGASGGIAAAVGRSWHARRLVDLGFAADVAFCSQVSVSTVLPVMDRASGLIVPG